MHELPNTHVILAAFRRTAYSNAPGANVNMGQKVFLHRVDSLMPKDKTLVKMALVSLARYEMPPLDFLMISSRVMLSNSVPFCKLFKFTT